MRTRWDLVGTAFAWSYALEEHNSWESTFELELNGFADMTVEEFASTYNGNGKGPRVETQSMKHTIHNW